MESEKKEKKYGVIKFSLLLLLYIFYCVVYFTFKNDLGGRGLVKDFFWIVPFVIYFMNAKRIKNNYFIKFIISSFLFCYLYYFMYISVSESHISSAFLAVIFSYIIIIFMHIPLFIYALYCFSKVCGRVSKIFGLFSGVLLGICVLVLLFYPNYITNKQIDQLCKKSNNNNFPKIPSESCKKIKCIYNMEYLKNEIILKSDNLKNIKSFSDFWILDDGQIIIYKLRKIKCYFAKCFAQEYYLLDKENKKIERKSIFLFFDLFFPYTNYRHGMCEWVE